MNRFLLPFFLLIANVVLAQSGATTSDANPTLPISDSTVVVEQMPEYPGGIPALGEFLQQNLRYPRQARKANVTGKVFASFVVGADGVLRDISIAKGIGYGCDEEVVRVIALMPKWKPGIQSGKAVPVRYSMPISFTLSNR
jgi:protein TonB